MTQAEFKNITEKMEHIWGVALCDFNSDKLITWGRIFEGLEYGLVVLSLNRLMLEKYANYNPVYPPNPPLILQAYQDCKVEQNRIRRIEAIRQQNEAKKLRGTVEKCWICRGNGGVEVSRLDKPEYRLFVRCTCFEGESLERWSEAQIRPWADPETKKMRPAMVPDINSECLILSVGKVNFLKAA